MAAGPIRPAVSCHQTHSCVSYVFRDSGAPHQLLAVIVLALVLAALWIQRSWELERLKKELRDGSR